MSRLSIYGTPWLNLIFENKNQAYGAYQLRRDSVKNSFTALFMGLLFVASTGGIFTIISRITTKVVPTSQPPEWSMPIKVSYIVKPIVEKPLLPEVQSQVIGATIDSDQLINPVVVHPENTFQNIATHIENNSASTNNIEGSGTIGTNPTTSQSGTEIAKTVDYGNTIVNSAILDKMPEFPGGINKFYNYVGNNFEKPEIEAITTFRIFVSFVIEKDGSMTDIQAIKDPGFGLGKEAIRVLKSLKTKWSPGMIDSKAVRTAYTLPIVLDMQ